MGTGIQNGRVVHPDTADSGQNLVSTRSLEIAAIQWDIRFALSLPHGEACCLCRGS